jgi:hypothetical protein
LKINPFTLVRASSSSLQTPAGCVASNFRRAFSACLSQRREVQLAVGGNGGSGESAVRAEALPPEPRAALGVVGGDDAVVRASVKMLTVHDGSRHVYFGIDLHASSAETKVLKAAFWWTQGALGSTRPSLSKLTRAGGNIERRSRPPVLFVK